jgi:hypothetical protein
MVERSGRLLFYYLKAEEMTFISSAFFRDGTDLFLCQEIKEILHGLFSKLHIPSPINDEAENARDVTTILPAAMIGKITNPDHNF